MINIQDIDEIKIIQVLMIRVNISIPFIIPKYVLEHPQL